jgi:DNA invertase Pin-like site-specific DNA recombinase
MGERKAGAANVHADREQVEEIQRYAQAVGAELVILAPELDVSGGAPLEQRPSLLAAIEGVERGEFDGIVVSYLSRLGRNVREQLRAWDRVEAAGGRIICVRENFDTSTPHGRLHRTFMLGIAEHELDLHKERFERLREWATEAGIWQRRQTPRGYDRDPATRRLVPNQQAAEVQAAFRDHAAGTSVRALAARLAMTPAGIRHLLSNRVYLGELKVGRHVNPAAHPALVDEATFALCQANRPRPPRRVTEGPALLAGLVRCAGCGHVMTRAVTQRVVYVCTGRHSGGDCPAPAAITLANLDAHVEQIALAELEQLTATATHPNDTVSRAREVLARAERELAAYVEAISAAQVGARVFAEGARQRQQAVDAANAELQAAFEADALPRIRNAAHDWPTLTAQERNALLRSLLAGVIVRRAGRPGRAVPVEERVRVLRHGFDLELPQRSGSAPLGIHPLPLPHPDHPDVLRLASTQDRLVATGG